MHGSATTGARAAAPECLEEFRRRWIDHDHVALLREACLVRLQAAVELRELRVTPESLGIDAGRLGVAFALDFLRVAVGIGDGDLALAIGVNSALFTLVHGVLLRQVIPVQPEQVVNVFTARKDASKDYRQFSHAEYLALRAAKDRAVIREAERSLAQLGPDQVDERREQEKIIGRARARLRYRTRVVLWPVAVLLFLSLALASGLFERVPLTWIAAASPGATSARIDLPAAASSARRASDTPLAHTNGAAPISSPCHRVTTISEARSAARPASTTNDRGPRTTSRPARTTYTVDSPTRVSVGGSSSASHGAPSRWKRQKRVAA